MVLGMLAEETGLYGGVDVTVKDDGRDLSEAIKTAIQNLPQGIYVNPEIAPEDDASEVDYNVKPMCYKTESGRLFMRVEKNGRATYSGFPERRISAHKSNDRPA